MILSVLEGGDAVCVAVQPGQRQFAVHFDSGLRLPAHLAATGQAQLACLPPADVAGRFSEDATGLQALPARQRLERLTDHGPASVAELIRWLQRMRRRGHSIDDEAVFEGVVGIGAAVFDATGTAIAGVGVCLCKTLLDATRLAHQRTLVMQAAQTLTQRLGGVCPSAARPRFEGLKA